MTAPPRKPGTDLIDQVTTTMDQPPRLQDTRFFGHPRGLATLFTTEMWERFSYYGLRPLLVLFMTAALVDGGFAFERGQASAIVGIYAAFVYLASLPGGWIADRLLGLRRAIFWGAVLIASGHLSIGLSAFAASRLPFFLGLVLIVLGTGLLKPNISAIVGDLYPEGGARRDAGFSIFYMGINIGAFFGQLITGFLGEIVGWHFGFGAAGVGMLLGLITYSIFAPKTLGDIGTAPSRHPDPAVQTRFERRGWMGVGITLGILALVIVLSALGIITLNPQAIGESMTYILVGTAVVYFAFLFLAGGLVRDEKKRIAVIFVLFVFAAIFWSAFEQAPTSLNLFARDFTDRMVDFSWLPGGIRTPFLVLGAAAIVGFAALAVKMLAGRDRPPSARMIVGLLVAGLLLLTLGAFAGRTQFEIPATWFQSVNALFVIVLAPVFAWLWVAMSRRGGDLSSPAKFSLGLLCAGVGFMLMIWAANRVVGSGGGLLVSPWWLVGSYFFQTVGELALSPVGLSSMTKLSPQRYVGQMMGIWFLAAAVGNLIAGLVGGHVDPENLEQMPQLFTATTVSLVVAAAVLALLIVPIRRMMATTGKRTDL